MRFSHAIQACCLFASVFMATQANADKRYYPLPSSEPLEIGAEEFRDRFLTLRRIEGVYVDFGSLGAAGFELGISVPKNIFEKVQQKLESAGLLF
ncbi:MAG: hypothetical protein AAF404_07605, partial [Pseudomonadota bacterium]